MQLIGSRIKIRFFLLKGIVLTFLLPAVLLSRCSSPAGQAENKTVALADSLIENKSFPLADDLVGYFTVEYSTSHPKKEHEVKNYAALALFYHFRSLADSRKALAVGSFLLSNAQVLSDKYRAGLYNDLGICYAMGQKYDSATTCIKLAVPLLQKLHDSTTLARSLNSLGNIHLLLKKLPEALDYYNQSLAINSKVQSLSGMALNLLNIAIVLEDTHRPDSAKKVLQQALPLASKAGRKRIVADVANNLGSIYFVEKMYDSAVWYYTLAAEQKQDSDPYSSLSISINRAISNAYTGRLQLGIDSLEQAVSRAQKLGFGSLMGEAAHITSAIYEKSGRLPEALRYERIACAVKDSIAAKAKEEVLTDNINAADLSENEYQRQFNDQLELQKARQLRNFLLFGIAFTVLFSLFMIAVYKKQRRVSNQLQIATADLEEANANLRMISEIGQDIITHTDHSEVVEHLYLHLANLLPVDVLAIGVYNHDSGLLEFRNTIEEQQTLPLFSYHLSESNSLATLCFNEQRRIVVGNLQWEAPSIFGKEVLLEAKAGRVATSLVYLPLTVNHNRIGVFTVQSFQPEVFLPHHVSTLESIGVYLAIALQNTIHFESVVSQRDQLNQALNQLQVSEAQLRETNASKDKLFSIIAHDLRNPFSTILGFSDVLTKDWKNFDEATKQTFIKSISLASLSTYRLVENLLMWSRTQTGGLVFNPENIDMGNVVLEAVKAVSSMAENKQIHIVNAIPYNTTLVADENMLQTVLRNLLNNAIKFSHRAGVVEVGASFSSDCCEVWVADQGIGIDPEDAARLFKIDQSIKRNGTLNETGSGLGLLLCYELISRHRGKIWVESEPDKGSRFAFSIPLDIQKTKKE